MAQTVSWLWSRLRTALLKDRIADWEREYGGWEIWECPTCGTQQGFGHGSKAASIPRCTLGHKPVEMEQKFEDAMPAELRRRALSNPNFRVKL